MDKEILIQRIELLCAERKIKPTTAYVESGVGKNFKSNLSVANPSLAKITLLANYLNVSREYLLGETEIRQKESPSVTPTDERVRIAMEHINGLSSEELDALIPLLEQMRKANKGNG